jgi:hypothetical protein
MHSIQGSFSWLKLPLPASNHPFWFDVLQVVSQLHQLQCWMVEINQTRTVYDAVWDEQQTLCRAFHKMLFSDIEKSCHISCYHNGWL